LSQARLSHFNGRRRIDLQIFSGPQEGVIDAASDELAKRNV